MPGKRGKKVGQASREKDIKWINCEECGRLELLENRSELKEDSEDAKDAVFQCRLCQMEAEISSMQKGVESKMANIEKQIAEITKKQKDLEEKQAEIKIDIGSKVDSEAVEPMFDRVSELESAQAELVVSISEMKGEWPTIAEANSWNVFRSKKERKDATERESGIVRSTSGTTDTIENLRKPAVSKTMDEGSRGRIGKGGSTVKKASKKLYRGASALPFRKAGFMRSKQAAGTSPNLAATRRINNGSEAAHKGTAAEKKERDGGTKVLAQKKTETNMIRKAGAKRGEEVNLRIKGTGNAEDKVTKKMSFKEKCKDLKEGTVVLIGDSMIRGVGAKMRRDNTMFTPIANGGARIESITWSLKNKQVKQLRDESHLVVMVGTNNLKGEGTEVIMNKYKDLIETMKEVKCRKLTMVGILTRGDENEYLESKRIGLNQRLSELCARNGVEFVDPSNFYDAINAGKPAQERRRIETRVLDRWGLHLNEWGQEQVARILFKHCVEFLN